MEKIHHIWSHWLLTQNHYAFTRDQTLEKSHLRPTRHKFPTKALNFVSKGRNEKSVRFWPTYVDPCLVSVKGIESTLKRLEKNSNGCFSFSNFILEFYYPPFSLSFSSRARLDFQWHTDPRYKYLLLLLVVAGNVDDKTFHNQNLSTFLDELCRQLFSEKNNYWASINKNKI